jgi:putative ABC transport system substrate-binding protein
MPVTIGRRELIAALGGAAVAWPLAARAQQSAMPVIGFLDARSQDAVRERLRAFRQGLKDHGYAEGENVTITYRFAENQIDRLPALAADLVRHRAAVIATAGDDVAVAAGSNNHDSHCFYCEPGPGQAWSRH